MIKKLFIGSTNIDFLQVGKLFYYDGNYTKKYIKRYL